MDKKDAYKIVFEDMLKNGPKLFQGIVDKTATDKDNFVLGINIVMEYIAYNVNEEIGDDFSDLFFANYLGEQCIPM